MAIQRNEGTLHRTWRIRHRPEIAQNRYKLGWVTDLTPHRTLETAITAVGDSYRGYVKLGLFGERPRLRRCQRRNLSPPLASPKISEQPASILARRFWARHIFWQYLQREESPLGVSTFFEAGGFVASSQVLLTSYFTAVDERDHTEFRWIRPFPACDGDRFSDHCGREWAGFTSKQ